jgi:5-methylcytosine-specific restriction endonuclease McrA
MAKHGEEGLGYVLVKAVINGDIKEPLTYEKIKKYCNENSIDAKENHLKVILSNASANTHSHNYKRYFKRVGRGEYVVLPEYKNKQRCYWLNVDSKRYNWSFLDFKVGKSQTFSNLNPNGIKRKNEQCFNEIKVGDMAVAYETGKFKAITTLCKVKNKFTNGSEINVEFQKIRDFEIPLKLDALKKVKELKDCVVVNFHIGTLFELEKKHFEAISKHIESINIPEDSFEKLYISVKKSMKDTSDQRKQRLENRSSLYPDLYETSARVYRRNADVIAEVLIRANGVCERCRKNAPFNRASDGTPYLEVHHLIRLADGGEDTVGNAIAVCPNCHRELHFG